MQKPMSNFHVWLDPQTQCALPWADAHPWVLLPGVLIAVVAADDPQLDLPTLVSAWLTVVIHAGAAIVAVAAACKVIQKWKKDTRQNNHNHRR